jgi:hypothetical protein
LYLNKMYTTYSSQNKWATFISVFLFCFLQFSEFPVSTKLSLFLVNSSTSGVFLFTPYISYHGRPLIIVLQIILKTGFAFYNVYILLPLLPCLCQPYSSDSFYILFAIHSSILCKPDISWSNPFTCKIFLIFLRKIYSSHTKRLSAFHRVNGDLTDRIQKYNMLQDELFFCSYYLCPVPIVHHYLLHSMVFLTFSYKLYHRLHWFHAIYYINPLRL